MADLYAQLTKDFNPQDRLNIAVGLAEPDEEIIESLERANPYAHVIAVGPSAIKDVLACEINIADKPEEELVDMLINGEVQGIVRGSLDDFLVKEAYEQRTGEHPTVNPILLRDPKGHQFFMIYVTNPEGWTKEDRLAQGLAAAQFMKESGIEPNIAVFTAERQATYERKKEATDPIVSMLHQTVSDAEWIVAQLKVANFQATNWQIDLNLAVEAGANLLLPVNGLVSNQLFRVIVFCGGQILAGPRVGVSRFYEDTSRSEKDFEPHIKYVASRIQNAKRKGSL